MTRPRVSVLMPTWNRLGFLPHAMASVLGQSCRELELIVIDDGSTDGTREWLEEQEDPRLRVIRRDHEGIGASLNAGLKVAQGEWLGRLDSDDEWDPEYLALQLAEADKHPEVVAVYCRAEAADAELRGKQVFRGAPMPIAEDALASLLMGDFTCNITVLGKLDVIREVGGWKEELPHGEDWDLWLRVARHGTFHFHPRVLARYREHGGNVTQEYWEEMPEVRASILRSQFDDPSFPPAAQRWRKPALRREHVNGAMAARSVGAKDLAATRMKRAYAEGDGPVRTSLYALLQWLAWCVAPRHPSVRKAQRWALGWRDRLRRRD